MTSGWYLGWLLLLPVVGQAQAVLPLPADFEVIIVEKPFLLQLRQPPASLGAPGSLPLNRSAWQAVERINYGRGSATGWAQFSVRTHQPRTLWLELTTHFMDSVGVWLGGKNMPLRRVPGPSAYRQQATPLAPVNHHYFLYALELPANQTLTVWIQSRVIPGDALKYGVRLWVPRHFLTAQQRDLGGWSLFGGVVLAILGGVGIAFLFYRRTLYLHYALYILCLSAYAFFNDGWGAFLPDSLAWFDRITTIAHWLNLGFGAFVLFSGQFLSVSARARKSLVFRWPEGVPMALVCGLIFWMETALATGNETLAQTIYGLGAVCFGGYMFIWYTYLNDAYRHKSGLVWLLVGAVSTVMIFFAINALLFNTGLVQNPLPDMLALRLALLLEFTILSIGWLYRRKLTQNARQRLEIQNRQLQADVIMAQEAERQRIAADLHDDLGGTLATLRRRFSDIQLQTTDANTRFAFAQTEPLLQTCIDDLRRIAHNLMPPEFARLGLRSALERLVRSQAAEPHFSFVTCGNPVPLDTAIELNAYRIMAELVHNVAKHARAKRAVVQLLYMPNHVFMSVEDDGVGFFSAPHTNNFDGIGLKTNTLRANYMGATLWRDMGAAGTLVTLTIPCPASQHGTSFGNANSSG